MLVHGPPYVLHNRLRYSMGRDLLLSERVTCANVWRVRVLSHAVIGTERKALGAIHTCRGSAMADVAYEPKLLGAQLPEDESEFVIQVETIDRIVREHGGSAVDVWDFHFNSF